MDELKELEDMLLDYAIAYMDERDGLVEPAKTKLMKRIEKIIQERDKLKVELESLYYDKSCGGDDNE